MQNKVFNFVIVVFFFRNVENEKAIWWLFSGYIWHVFASNAFDFVWYPPSHFCCSNLFSEQTTKPWWKDASNHFCRYMAFWFSNFWEPRILKMTCELKWQLLSIYFQLNFRQTTNNTNYAQRAQQSRFLLYSLESFEMIIFQREALIIKGVSFQNWN